MVAINIILVVVGLSLCFGGIYFKKLFAGLMAFWWSFILGSLILEIMTLVGNIESSFGMLLLGIIVIASTVICVIYDRVCAAINTFMCVFSIMLILAFIMADSDNLPMWIIIAIVISLIPANISYHFYNLAFILHTAFTGGFIASIGGFGLFNGFDTSVLGGAIFSGYSGGLTPILIGTFILGCMGTVAQWQNLNQNNHSAYVGSKFNASHGIDTASNSNMNYRTNNGAYILGSIKDLYKKTIHSEILADLCSEKLCLFIAFVGFVILPLVNDYMSLMETDLALFVERMYAILEAAAFAGVIYIAYEKKMGSGIIYCIPYLVVRFIIDRGFVTIPYFMAFVLLRMCGPFIILFVSSCFNRITKTDFKYWLSVLTFIFYEYFLLRWVNVRVVYWTISKDNAISIIAFIIMLAVLVYVRKKKNIFDIALFINQRAGRQVTNNRVVAIVAGALVVILAGAVMLKDYEQKKKRYENSAARQYKNRNNKKTNDSSDLPELDADYLSGSSWDVLCMFDDNGNEVSQYDILGNFGEESETTFGISFYGPEDGSDENNYGLFLGSGTRSEMDGQRWGKYSCKNNILSLECDMHGDVLELEHTSVTYEDKVYEALKLTTTITTDEYWDENIGESDDEYTLYLVNSLDLSTNHDNQGSESDIDSEEMLSILTAEPWKVYKTYDYDTDEEFDVGQIYGETAADEELDIIEYLSGKEAAAGINHLIFDKNGTFRFALGDFTSNYDDGEMTGIYECSGNQVTLYSDSSTEIIKMKYTSPMYYLGLKGMYLQWIDSKTDTTTKYRVYFATSSTESDNDE